MSDFDHDDMLRDLALERLSPILPDRKSIFKSKTFWLQVVTLLSTLSPQIRDFIANNPVEFSAVIVAVNTIMRFATSGEVTLSVSSGEEKRGGGTWIPLLATMVGLAVFGGTALPGLLAI